MRLPEQLELFDCSRPALPATTQLGEESGRFAARPYGNIAPWLQGDTALHDVDLQVRASELLRANGAARIAKDVRVEWSPRLKSCAGRADYRAKLISLNPRLRGHGAAEIDRTLRHELAHLLAKFRAGRRRILPHGHEWRAACHDLGISDEKRCHNLPFPIRERVRRFLYKCPNCRRDFTRVRRIRRAIACLACCRAHNGGEFDPRFRLRLVTAL
jgi:predicted SprT family Zn-dependent metalloprotease